MSPKALMRCAQAVGETLPPQRWHSKVRHYLERRNEEPLAVACSGGADSVALLCALWVAFPGRVRVVHFDHNTRGGESAADAAFVRDLAETLRVPCECGVREKARGDANEAVLREARMMFFRESMAGMRARMLLTGHHADDVAETLLMRLARGSGPEGLAAPRPVQRHGERTHLRPFLELPKTELVAALEKAGMLWHEDASNATEAYLRNRVRLRVIPELEQAVGRAFAPGAARARMLLEEQVEAIGALAAQVVPETGPLRWKDLKSQPRAVWRQALWMWLGRQGLAEGLSAVAFDALLEQFEQGGAFRQSVGEGLVCLQGGVLCVENPLQAMVWDEVPLLLGEGVSLPNGMMVCLEVVELNKDRLDSILRGEVDASREALLLCQGGLRVRNWRKGDCFRPLGAPGRRKLQDLFTDRKIPLDQRHALPVVTDEAGAILWVPGLPPAQKARLEEGVKRALRLTYGKPA